MTSKISNSIYPVEIDDLQYAKRAAIYRRTEGWECNKIKIEQKQLKVDTSTLKLKKIIFVRFLAKIFLHHIPFEQRIRTFINFGMFRELSDICRRDSHTSTFSKVLSTSAFHGEPNKTRFLVSKAILRRKYTVYLPFNMESLFYHFSIFLISIFT